MIDRIMMSAVTAAVCGVCSVSSAQTGVATVYADRDTSALAGATPTSTFGSGSSATMHRWFVRDGSNDVSTLGATQIIVAGRDHHFFTAWAAIRFDLQDLYSLLDSVAGDTGLGDGDWRITGASVSLTPLGTVLDTPGTLIVHHATDDHTLIDPTEFDPPALAPGHADVPSTLVPPGALGSGDVLASIDFNPVSSTPIGAEVSGVVLTDLNNAGDLELTILVSPSDDGVFAAFQGQYAPLDGRNAPALTIEYVLEPQGGACCDGFTVCIDAADVADCAALDLIFLGGANCIDLDADGTAETCENLGRLIRCRGDTDQDGDVDAIDFINLLVGFGRETSGSEAEQLALGDFNLDGVVDAPDFIELLTTFGRPCQPVSEE
ncbi:MAG: hypothetical protein AAGI30_01515 [Planctomycetota bacterium]